MDGSKNGGPNHLKAWRHRAKLTLAQVATEVGTDESVISLLESSSRGLSAKWLRRLAPVLGTTPGFLLDHDPADLPQDVLETWLAASARERQQIADIVKAVVKTGTIDPR